MESVPVVAIVLYTFASMPCSDLKSFHLIGKSHLTSASRTSVRFSSSSKIIFPWASNFEVITRPDVVCVPSFNILH